MKKLFTAILLVSGAFLFSCEDASEGVFQDLAPELESHTETADLDGER